MIILKNALIQSHNYIKAVVEEGDIVVDATAGNGNDTLMLAKLVGETGKVYSFDIQEKAINNTYKKLSDEGVEKRVVLIKDGHQNMDKYVTEKGKVKAVMFNLGYLPGGDHSIATKPSTTIEAIKKAMNIIMTGGLISIVVYYGGDTGFEERDKVMEFVCQINPKEFVVMKACYVNQINCPPFLLCIEKIK
ncbi:MAG TPA: methyltransferase domain-containing protein [Clostridiaceae bacterium]|nr:methyltransferase domain-containing protein [Clostridiaceae bacterium]